MSTTRRLAADRSLSHVEACVELIRRYDYVTFAKLLRLLERRDVETKGSFAIPLGHPDVENIFLWFGLSDEASTIVLDLLGDERVKLDAASQLTYLLDGRMPAVKVARAVRKYKTPRWTPVCFRPAGTVKT